MARPLKNGLDYFPFDVSLYEDEKLIDVQFRYGPLGESIYTRLLCLVYKNGYYYRFESMDKLASILIRSIGTRWVRNKQTVIEVIGFLAECNLFSPELMQRGVLTSRGIQLRYQVATERRQSNIVEYNLLEKNDFQEAVRSIPKNKVNVAETPINAAETPLMQAISTQSKVKQRKVFLSDTTATSDQESEGKPDVEPFPPSLDDVIAIAKQAVSEEAAKRISKKFWGYYNGTGWVTKNGAPIRDWQNTLAHWLETERESKSNGPKKAKGTIYDEFIYNE